MIPKRRMVMVITSNTTVEQFLTEIMPKEALDMLQNSNAPKELSGTEITMVVEVDGKSYGFKVKDGKDITPCGDIPNAMLRLKISGSDLKKMIDTNNLDMLLGMQKDLTRARYNALSSLKGSFIAKLKNDDGSEFTIEAILNGATSPQSIFRMSTKDSAALMKKETNPVNLFMSGAMKIEGDMSFAMATQPLFT
jgi:putative sterol carrier protein